MKRSAFQQVSPKPRELELVSLAVELGATEVGGSLTADELYLVEQARVTEAAPAVVARDVTTRIRKLEDPLGAALSKMRPTTERRRFGAFYTPLHLVQTMVDWVLAHEPSRIVDAGCGSGRFSTAAVHRNLDLDILAVDVDPLATLLSRASLAVLGARRATVIQGDYTTLNIPRISGRTAFLANPPYVRHHNIDPHTKAWATAASRRLGHKTSGLAGLHSYFFLATLLKAEPKDVGCFVTSSEWIDVNYGSLIRDLFLNGLGGRSLHVIDPRSVPFEDAMTTAAIACFEVGSNSAQIRLQFADSTMQLGQLDRGRQVPRDELLNANRWSHFFHDRFHPTIAASHATIPLGSIARVHRGVVTGANDYFVLTREKAQALGILRWCRPAITSAEEIFESDGVVRDSEERKLLLDAPRDVARNSFPELDTYLRLGETSQNEDPPICERYIPRHRRPWWFLGSKPAPPIIATYMARRPPAFACNPDGLALVNIAHGIYPSLETSKDQIATLVAVLNAARSSFQGRGRTYHGGLEKFEPGEMEALPIPAEVWLR